MHAMNDRIDMRRFGGLWRAMPITFATFACGYLAIIGFPFLSGFCTKDKIIEAALRQGRHVAAGSSASRRCSAPASPRST